MWESRRKSCPGLTTDVYDSPRWKKLAGPVTQSLVRILYQYCVDAFPWNNRKHGGSMKPAHILLASLPPWLRYKVENMILHMFVPEKVKGLAAKKYYDFAARYEMNQLHDVGVDGVRFIMLGTTLDTPGRREMLNMESVQAFYPCPHCLHTWQPGLRTQTYGGYRCFLPENSPWRRKSFVYKGLTYWFRDVETRPRPMRRTDQTVRASLGFASEKKPFCGHKGPPMLQDWRTDWDRSCCDEMHDVKCMCGMCLQCLVGNNGEYDWSKDASHRQDCITYDMFPSFQNGGPPPWRLSKPEIAMLDLSIRTMMLPHYTHPLEHHQHSFWTHPDRIWKAKHKLYVVLVLLPTCLHFCAVRAVLHALLVLVHALRLLAGHTISIAEAQARGVEPGERVLEHIKILRQYHDQLVRGLVLLEGSFPVDQLNPALHHLVHYAMMVFLFGVLALLSMFSFERNNKRMKKLVRNSKNPDANLSKNVEMDIATRCRSMPHNTVTCLTPYHVSHQVCVLHRKKRHIITSETPVVHPETCSTTSLVLAVAQGTIRPSYAGDNIARSRCDIPGSVCFGIAFLWWGVGPQTVRLCGDVYPSWPFPLLRGEVVLAGAGQGVRTRQVVVGTRVPLRPKQAGGTCAYADGCRTGGVFFGDSDRDHRANPCCSDFGPR